MGTTESNCDTNIRPPHYRGGALIGAGTLTLEAHLGDLNVQETFQLSPGQSRIFRAVALSDGLFGIPSPLPGRQELIDISALCDLMGMIFGFRWSVMADALGQTHTHNLVIGWALQQRYPLAGQ